MKCETFADAALMQLCLATEAAEKAASAAEKAAEAPSWIEKWGAVIGWTTALLPWAVLFVVIWKFWPLLTQFWPILKQRLEEGGGAKVKAGTFEFELIELQRKAMATALDLSYDLMDVSAVLDIEQELNWPKWTVFKPKFTVDGLVLLAETDENKTDINKTDKKGTIHNAVLRPGRSPKEKPAKRELFILWIDDQEQLTDYRVKFLQRRDYTVTVRQSTASAFTAIESKPFDCVVTNADLGGDSDGWRDIFYNLRIEDENQLRPRTPFIVLTSPSRAQTLMSPTSDFTHDKTAFATFSFTLIRHRLRWLEEGIRDKPPVLRTY